MGGYGSGRRRDKPDEGSYLKLNIGTLSREGALADGGECLVRWHRGGALLAQLRIEATQSELRLRSGSQTECGRSCEIELPVRVTWTQCHYGGRRPWFLCPRGGCERRVAILYGDYGDDFACRVCLRLAYDTQCIPLKSRALDRAQRLRVRLGGSVDMTQPFPSKPKGMHFFRYMKLAMRAWRAEDQANAEMRDWLDSIRPQ